MFLLFIGVQFLQPAISAPVPAPEQQKEFVSWNREPQTRGTFSLLSSCLITLSLSVWTAVHLNVTVEQLPHEKLSFFRRLNSRPAVRRLKWMLMGLLAPELVVYTAWQQWSSAREMTRKMRELLKKVITLPHPLKTEANSLCSKQRRMGISQQCTNGLWSTVFMQAWEGLSLIFPGAHSVKPLPASPSLSHISQEIAAN